MPTTTRWRGGAEWRLPATRIWAPAFAVALGVAAIIRARYGVDYGDGSHAVALALRMARGDLPFRDELNLQVLGAWPAVPFVWAWVHAFGVDGIVLASRVWFVVFSALCGYIGWRAVSPLFGRGTTAAALGVALIPAAYNQQVVSYNTTPALMYLVAACAGLAAVTQRSLPWGLVAGATAVLGAMSHPVSAPAAVLLLLAVLVQTRGRALVGVMAGAAAVGAVVALLAVFVWGWSSITDTLSYTELYQAARPAREARLSNWWLFYRTALSSWWFYSAAALGLLAAVPPLRRIRSVLLVGAIAATGILALQQGAQTPTYTVQTWYSSVLGIVLVVVLLPVTVVCAVRRRAPLARVVPIGLASYLGVPVIAAFTSGAPAWGASAAVLAPSLFVAALAAIAWVQRDGGVAQAAVALALVASLGTVHALNSYRDAPLPDLVATVPSGPFAGLVTTEDRRDRSLEDARAISRCASPGESMLAYLFPSAFLFQDVRFATPIIWTVAGASSGPALLWLRTSGQAPDCVVAARNFWPGYGHDRAVSRPDPLRDWVRAHYHQVAETSGLVLLRRDS